MREDTAKGILLGVALLIAFPAIALAVFQSVLVGLLIGLVAVIVVGTIAWFAYHHGVLE